MQSKSDSILEKIANMQKVKKFMEMGMSKEDAMKKAYPNMKKEAKMEMAPKKKSNFGMLSVKAGIDNNPAPTKADRIAGAKMKKEAYGGSYGNPMKKKPAKKKMMKKKANMANVQKFMGMGMSKEDAMKKAYPGMGTGNPKDKGVTDPAKPDMPKKAEFIMDKIAKAKKKSKKKKTYPISRFLSNPSAMGATQAATSGAMLKALGSYVPMPKSMVIGGAIGAGLGTANKKKK